MIVKQNNEDPSFIGIKKRLVNYELKASELSRKRNPEIKYKTYIREQLLMDQRYSYVDKFNDR